MSAHVLGVTGFQASCADMDFLRRTRSMENGFSIVNYENLLYPQYFDDEHFPTKEMLIEQNKKWLAEAAQKKIAENAGAHPDVIAWWKHIAALSN